MVPSAVCACTTAPAASAPTTTPMSSFVQPRPAQILFITSNLRLGGGRSTSRPGDGARLRRADGVEHERPGAVAMRPEGTPVPARSAARAALLDVHRRDVAWQRVSARDDVLAVRADHAGGLAERLVRADPLADGAQ